MFVESLLTAYYLGLWFLCFGVSLGFFFFADFGFIFFAHRWVLSSFSLYNCHQKPKYPVTSHAVCQSASHPKIQAASSLGPSPTGGSRSPKDTNESVAYGTMDSIYLIFIEGNKVMAKTFFPNAIETVLDDFSMH